MRLKEDRVVHATESRVERWPEADCPEFVVVASGLNVLAGMWLIIAPYLLPGLGPAWNEVALGAGIALCALARVAGAWRFSVLSYASVVMGALLAASALVVDGTTTAVLNDFVVGVAVIASGAASARVSARAPDA